jgi:large subunit ribosomal protein L5
MLQEKYKKEIVPILMEKLSYKNPMAVPKLEKIVVNSGIGKILGEVEASKRQERYTILGEKGFSEEAAERLIEVLELA